jgi:FlaA1/EpsC-like NDP-sugar epimerase
MQTVYLIHNLFGERVLPVLVLAALVWLAVSWRPDAKKHVAARVLPVLIDVHVTLGLVMFIFGAAIGNVRYTSLPFLFHPILGLVTAGYGHMAVKGVPFRRLGRWAVVASLVVLLLLVLANVLLAKQP